MKSALRVEGIYNSETLKSLRDEGLSHFLFDFRPRSFNFIQIYVLEEIMKQHFNYSDNYILLFKDEPEFVVNKILDDIEKSVTENNPQALGIDNIKLEFWDQKDTEYYDSFEKGYTVLFDPRLDVKSLLSSRYFEGFVFSSAWLKSLHEKNSFIPVMTEFLKVYYADKNNRKKLCLKIDDVEDLFPSLSEYLDSDLKSFSIDQNLEVSYRHVDYPRLKQFLSYVQTI